MPALVVRYRGTEVTVEEKDSVVIGSGDDATINVVHPGVSRRHASIQYEGDGWALHDSGSTNGTYFEGERIDRLDIVGVVEVRLGHPDQGEVLELQTAPNHRRSASSLSTEISSATVPATNRVPMHQLVVATWALTAAVLILSIAVLIAAFVD